MIESLYIHIPFCAKRCDYCDFSTCACNDDALMDAYVDALSLQLRRASRAGLLGGIRTIYIGGGTPSYLGARRLNSLVYLISLSVNLENVHEFTLEANPDSLDETMVKDLFALGVDRFSLGAQSFSDAELAQFGRIHDARQIETAVRAVQTRCDNVSLDLICGAPWQSMESWEASLRRAVDLGVKHVSVYPLMVEEGTPLCARVEAGECADVDEDVQAQMMERASDVLGNAGMHRYEVASYAYPGFESRHNAAYWTGVEYLGLGAGASSMFTGATFTACVDAGVVDAEVPDLADDVRVRFASDFDIEGFSGSLGRPGGEVELLDARQAALEDLMLGMRQSRGVDEQQVAEACVLEPLVQGVFDGLVADGLVETADGRYVPTQRGWLLGNEVFGRIWGLA